MSLLLAPYNNAMRLGMGFNSYTQSLCINDVVQKPNGMKADEGDLRSVDMSGQPAHSTSGMIFAADQGSMDLRPSSGSKVIEHSNGQVSQVVSWEAKFVDKISEITDSMNISGALAIQVDSIGGGAKAGAHYIDSNKFKESDLNYFINVQVTNQKLIADDVTEFAPIRNVQPSQFTEVYGDSFISGFLEGGVFNAVVSIKLKNKEILKDVGGEMAIKMAFTGVGVEGEAKGGKKTAQTQTESETTISVNWSGGGDIKPDDIKDWDIVSLKRVAMEFPDLVAKCPQRTSAILTKYTGLRSFYEQNLKGSPLDYENAGVYASALLDAYVDYKSQWKQLQTMTWELQNGLVTLEARENSTALQTFKKALEDNYTDLLTKYQDSQQDQSRSKSLATTGNKKGDGKPLPPNALVPYGIDVFGLDKARRDCRFEMIKIVREVDAVTHDPNVAIDPNRTWQYLSPIIFRLLVPKSTNNEETTNVEAGKAALKMLDQKKKELEEAQENLARAQKTLDAAGETLKAERATKESLQKEVEQKTQKLKEVQTNFESTQKALDATTKSTALTDAEKARDAALLQVAKLTKPAPAQSGIVWTGFQDPLPTNWMSPVKFETPLSKSPQIIYGLNTLDMRADDCHFSFNVRQAEQNGFTAELRRSPKTFLYQSKLSWLSLGDTGFHIEHGSWDTSLDSSKNARHVEETIRFAKAFDQPPTVLVWFKEFSQGKNRMMLRVWQAEVSNDSFKIHVSGEQAFDGAKVGWMAYDSREAGDKIQSGIIEAPKGKGIFKELAIKWPGAKFSKPPAVFVAMRDMDIDDGWVMRLQAPVIEVKTDEFIVNIGSWADTVLGDCHFTWIAME